MSNLSQASESNATKAFIIKINEALLPNRRSRYAPFVSWGVRGGVFGAEHSDDGRGDGLLPADGRPVRYEHGSETSLLPEDRTAS